MLITYINIAWWKPLYVGEIVYGDLDDGRVEKYWKTHENEYICLSYTSYELRSIGYITKDHFRVEFKDKLPKYKWFKYSKKYLWYISKKDPDLEEKYEDSE